MSKSLFPTPFGQFPLMLQMIGKAKIVKNLVIYGRPNNSHEFCVTLTHFALTHFYSNATQFHCFFFKLIILTIPFHQKHGFTSTPNNKKVILSEIISRFKMWKQLITDTQEKPFVAIWSPPKPQIFLLQPNHGGSSGRNYIHIIFMQMKSQMLEGL